MLYRNKVIAAILSVTLLLSSMAGIIVSLAAAPAVETEVIYEQDFSAATVRSDPWSTAATAGGAWPVESPIAGETGNIVVQHTPNFWGHGVILIGAPMTVNNANMAGAIAAEAGATYHVEFDYYFTGTNGTSAYTVGFGVGVNTGHNVDQGPAFSFKQAILSFDKGTTFDSTWKRVSVDITVPESTDFANGDTLMLYFNNGHGSASYYYDNVKISKVTGTPFTSWSSDFSGATVREDPWSTADSMGGAWPEKSTVAGESDNIVIRHDPGFWGHGVLPIGAPMTNNNANAAEAISAEAGVTYLVEFDYYFSGTNNTAAYNMGFAVGKVTGQNVDQGPAFSYKEAILTFDKGTTFDGIWKTARAYITVPESIDFTNGDKMMLYFNNGHGADVLYYYDNVKVSRFEGEPFTSWSSGFSDATVREEPYFTHRTTGNCYPVMSPVEGEDGNIVIYSESPNWGHGVIPIGAPMTTDEANIAAEVSAEAGATYHVEFDYYFTGKNTPVYEVGFGVGPATGHNVDQGPAFSFKQSILYIEGNTTFDGVWKTASADITIPLGTSFANGDKLMLYFKNGHGGNYYYDNVKVTKLTDQDYVVRFETNGGDPMEDYICKYDELSSLPAAVRNGYYFLGWYENEELTVRFNPQNHIGATEPITLYASWRDMKEGTLMPFENPGYYRNASGGLNGNTAPVYTLVENGGNTSLRFKLGYNADEKKEVRGECYGTYGTWGQAFGLYNELYYHTNSNASYEDVALSAKEGETYYVSFDYKILYLESDPAATAPAFMGGVYGANIGAGRQFFGTRVSSSGKVSEEWQTASIIFTTENFTADAGRNLAIFTFGYGEVLIDNVKVMGLNDRTYTVKFVTNGGDGIADITCGMAGLSALPDATGNDGKFFYGWYTDKALTVPFDTKNYVDTTAPITLYAKWSGKDGVQIPFETPNYYRNASGAMNSNTAPVYTLVEEDGNTALRFKLGYNDTEKKEVRGECYGTYGTWGQAFGLYNEPYYVANIGASNDKVAIIAKEGETYYITFDYKLVGLESSSAAPAPSFKAGVYGANIGAGRQVFGETAVNTSGKVSNEWQTARIMFTVEDLLAESGRNLAVFTYGYGEMLIDNVRVLVVRNAIQFETFGGESIEPIIGDVGDSYTIPATAVKDGCKFLGWFMDADFTKPAANGKIAKGITVIYAKFMRMQYIQDFEGNYVSYPIYRCDWFESTYWFNTPLRLSDAMMEWCQWTGEDQKVKYDKTGVRSGTNSVYNPGTNEYERLFTLLLEDQLIIGEEYTLSFWIKVDEYTMGGDIRLWFNNGLYNSVKLRTPVDWDDKESRAVTILNTSAIDDDHLGQWLEVKYDFVARGKFVGIGLPGLTTAWVDDACITVKSADASYQRTIDGPGIRFEDWYTEGAADGEMMEYAPSTIEKIIIKYADLLQTAAQVVVKTSVWQWIAIIGGSVVALGGVGALAAVLIVKKKRRKTTTQ